jgi:hypothetical protein
MILMLCFPTKNSTFFSTIFIFKQDGIVIICKSEYFHNDFKEYSRSSSEYFWYLLQGGYRISRKNFPDLGLVGKTWVFSKSCQKLVKCATEG